MSIGSVVSSKKSVADIDIKQDIQDGQDRPEDIRFTTESTESTEQGMFNHRLSASSPIGVYPCPSVVPVSSIRSVLSVSSVVIPRSTSPARHGCKDCEFIAIIHRLVTGGIVLIQ